MNSIEIIELLAQHEESIGKLCTAYARKFPEHYDFWATISNEELNHAGMLRGLSNFIEDGSVYFNENRFRPKTVEASIDYVQGEIARACEQNMELINALSPYRSNRP